VPKNTVYNKTKEENIYWYDTKEGKRFHVRINYKKANGKRSEKTKSGLINISTAKKARTEIQAIIDRNEIKTFDASKIIFKDWRKTYYDTMSPMWAKSTNETFSNIVKNHLSFFDQFRIADISKSTYQDFINTKLYNENYSVEFVKNINKTMASIINYAVEDDVLVRNKLKGIKIEKVEMKKKKYLEIVELSVADHYARKNFDNLKFAFYILLRIGWRRGEALGLKKGSVKVVEKNVIDVTVLNNRTRFNDESELKTKSSHRTNRLHGEYARAILKAIGEAEQIHNTHDKPFSLESRIFVNKSTCETYSVNYARYITDRLSKATGVKITPHMLRHSFATHSNADGQNIIAVADWLGHSPEVSRKVYTHVTEDQKRKIIAFANAN